MQKASPSWQDATEVRWRERSDRRTSSGLPKTPKWEKPLRRLVYDLTVLTQLWCNPEQRRFSRRRACGHHALARTPSQGTTHHTDDLAASLGLSRVRGANLEGTLGEDSPFATSMPATPATEVPEDHRNAGYGASANVPQVPQVHQSCVRTD